MTPMVRRRLHVAGAALVALAALLVWAASAEAQYFGRNKVQYRTFDSQVLSTDHFDIYYYPEEAEAARVVSRLAERWDARLSRFFGHQLRGRQAVILYAVPAHFQQTNAIEGLIGEGTGGVTEALRRRIVLLARDRVGGAADGEAVLETKRPRGRPVRPPERRVRPIVRDQEHLVRGGH